MQHGRGEAVTVLAGKEIRPYQHEASDKVLAAFDRGRGHNRLLVKKPTGTGKTFWFVSLRIDARVKAWLDEFPEDDRRMLVIAHREELLNQARATFNELAPDLMVDIEQGSRRANRYTDVVIASIQTLQAMKFRRLKRFIARHDFRIVVVDEAHHAAALTYRTALAHMKFLPSTVDEDGELVAETHDDAREMERALAAWDPQAPKDRLLLGVTATPNRTDAIGLGCVFQSIAFSYNLRTAIEDGWLVPIKPWVVETDTNLDNVRITHGEFNQKDLSEAVNTDRRNELAVAAWQQYAEGRPTLAFTVDVKHAHELAAAFHEHGIRALAISGETPKDERAEALAAFQRGELDVITNCMVLTEGTDLPITGCILHAKPTKSSTLYEQMTGRGLRLYEGKRDCVVIDLVDIAKRHSLQAAPVLYGLPPGLKVEGDDFETVEAGIEALIAKYPNLDIEKLLAERHQTLAELEVTARSFNVWDIEDAGEIANGLSMRWLKVGAETYRVSYPWRDGNEVITVTRDLLGHFDVVLTMHERLDGAKQQTIATQIRSGNAALAFGESFVSQHRDGVMKLKNREAKWRDGGATPGQIRYLRRLRVPFNEAELRGPGGKGIASDLIDLAQSKKGR